MRLALLILSCLTLFALIVGYMALVDVFDPMASKVIFAVNMGLLLFSTGLIWVFFLNLRQTSKNLDIRTRIHSVSGLLNRRETLKIVATQMKVARRHRFPYSVLLIGMDGFGEINNRVGHRGGDILLKHVGERIRSITRGEDISGHYEGDIFIIGASHADTEGSLKLAARVNKKITTEPYKTRGVSTELRISIAVGTSPPEDYDSETLLFKLEDRLKMAKSLGGSIIQSTD
ncbi:GGDEF domain-containing protein [bacterium]|nr:GGDEF domain-containing protein [bacterium]